MEKLLKENGLVQKVHNTLDTSTLPTVHYLDGTVCDFKYLNVIMMHYANQDKINISVKEEVISSTLNQEELKAFTITVLYQYILDDCPAAEKWIFFFGAIHGGDEAVYLMKNASNSLIADSRKAMTVQILFALTLTNKPSVISTLEFIADNWRTDKNNVIKYMIINAVRAFSKTFNLSDSMMDLVKISNFGFDMSGKKLVDYGNRKFYLVLDNNLNVIMKDEDNKVISKIPAVIQSDNQILATAQNSVLKDMKADLEKNIKAAKYSFSTALGSDETWNVTEFKNNFLNHSILRKYTISTIWATISDGKIVDTFRFTEDGNLNDVNENEFILKDTDVITIAHPFDLSEEVLNKWKSQLDDYELVQHFEQLERKVYKKDDVEHNGEFISSYKEIEVPYIPFKTVMSNSKWICGMRSFHKDFNDARVILFVEEKYKDQYDRNPSFYVLDKVYFTTKKEFTWQDYDNCDNVIPIKEIDDKLFSEVMYQISIGTIKRGKK